MFSITKEFFTAFAVEASKLEGRETKAGATVIERRRFHRYKVSFTCRVHQRKSKKGTALAEMRTETYDVSAGGLFFEASPVWSVGTEIEAELYLPSIGRGGQPIGIVCRGTIVRVVPKEYDRIGAGATIEHYKFFDPAKATSDPSESSLP